MCASTSRAVSRPWILSLSRPSSAAFSSTTASLARRQVIVELLKDVDGLGKAFDRVQVAPGRARNVLIPYRQARFIPYARGVDRTVSRQSNFSDGSHISSEFRIEGPGRPILSRDTTLPQETPQAILNALFSLPPKLIFPLRTTDPRSSTLHGSLTLEDVQTRLEKEYTLLRSTVDVTWEGDTGPDRMKELGTRRATVRVLEGGLEEAPLDIQVVRLAEEGQGDSRPDV